MTIHRHNQRSVTTHRPNPNTRRLKQILTILLAAIAGLLIGSFVLDQYRLNKTINQLESINVPVALDALDRLLPRAPRKPDLLDRIVPAIKALGPQAEEIAVWHLKTNPALPSHINARLITASDDEFILLADLLRRAGHWKENEQTADLLARREIHRFVRSRNRLEKKRFAMESIARLDARSLTPDTIKALASLLATAAHHENDDIATLAVRAAASVLDDDAIKSFVTSVTGSLSPPARAQNIITAGLRPAAQYPELFNLVAKDENETVLQALAWTLGRSDQPNAVTILESLLKGPPDSRRMALASLPNHHWNPQPATWQTWFTHEDTITRARALFALPSPDAANLSPDDFDQLTAENQAQEVRLAAYACLAQWKDAPPDAAQWLQKKLTHALQTGPDVEAAALIEAAPALAGPAFLDALTDIAANDQLPPMLRYIAAKTLVKIDTTAGHDALLQLLAIDNDTAAESAAWTLAHTPDPPIDLLIQNLASDRPLTRGRSALTIAYALNHQHKRSKLNRDAIVRERTDANSTNPKSIDSPNTNSDEDSNQTKLDDIRVPMTTLNQPPGVTTNEYSSSIPFTDWLRRKTNRSSPEFEVHWQTHGYYFQARLLLGHQQSRESLEIFLINANVSRLALYATLLAVNDPTPFNLLLTENSTTDLMSFLTQARFIEIIHATNPTTPTFNPYQDIHYRQYQLDRLKDWWHMKRQIMCTTK